MAPASLYAKLAEMRAEGMTYAQIGRAFDAEGAAVFARLHPRPRQNPHPTADECHGDCGRWIDRYRVGRQIVTPPDHCGGCARALSEQAKAEEEMRVRSFLQLALAG